MQTANIMLGIGGWGDNIFPKYGVTAAEIAVLRAIHGEDAVQDVEPLAGMAMDEDVKRSNRSELARLRHVYGKARDGGGAGIVDTLFPGAAARVFETVDELGLPPEYFKALSRVSAQSVPPESEEDAPEPVVKATRKKAVAKAPEPEPEPEDDIADMPALG